MPIRPWPAGECPYGDGRAAARIATALSRWLNGERPVLHDSEQFQGAASSEQVSMGSDELVGHAVEVSGEDWRDRQKDAVTAYVNGFISHRIVTYLYLHISPLLFSRSIASSANSGIPMWIWRVLRGQRLRY